MCMNYKIPDDILAKIPEHFWPAFAGELVSVFGHDLFETYESKDGGTESGLYYIGGTAGWNVALKMTCWKLNIDWLYDYYYKLEWYDSDLFDYEIECLIESKFVNKNKRPNAYYKWIIDKKVVLSYDGVDVVEVK